MLIRCGTFNLYQYVEPPFAWYEPENIYSTNEWASKNIWIKEQLLKMNCDVIGFQEVFSVFALKNLMKDNFPYFETVESPSLDPENSAVFIKPVVAIASRYPIISAETIEIPLTIIHQLQVKSDFKFSRSPIRAKISIDENVEVVVYVCHLKSKRPTVEVLLNTTDSWGEKVIKTLRARSVGQVASLLQRGAEAAILYHELTNNLSMDKDVPIILLGDLNDDEHSVPLEALTNREQIFDVGGTSYSELPNEAKAHIYNLKFYDSFNMTPNPSGQKRIPTHYYKGEGNVLDYIFVSNAFNEKNNRHIGRVTSFEVIDQHLRSDGINNKTQSDHAQVVATLEFRANRKH